MKINVEFDLDWLREDDTIDDAVSRKIISRAVDQVGEKIIKTLKDNVDIKINEKVDDFLNKVLAKFLDRNIVITDKWGNEINRYESVNELLETKFDEFIIEGVDKNGKTSRDRGCRIDGVPRIEHLIKSHINDKVAAITVEVNKEIDTYFKEKIAAAKTSIHKATIENYMKKIDFDAGLKK